MSRSTVEMSILGTGGGDAIMDSEPEESLDDEDEHDTANDAQASHKSPLDRHQALSAAVAAQ
jgi:hypothetical protein